MLCPCRLCSRVLAALGGGCCSKGCSNGHDKKKQLPKNVLLGPSLFDKGYKEIFCWILANLAHVFQKCSHMLGILQKVLVGPRQSCSILLNRNSNLRKKKSNCSEYIEYLKMYWGSWPILLKMAYKRLKYVSKWFKQQL